MAATAFVSPSSDEMLMPKAKELLAFGERWRPYRTVASWYLWRAFERAGYAATNKIRPAKTRRKRPRP